MRNCRSSRCSFEARRGTPQENRLGGTRARRRCGRRAPISESGFRSLPCRRFEVAGEIRRSGCLAAVAIQRYRKTGSGAFRRQSCIGKRWEYRGAQCALAPDRSGIDRAAAEFIFAVRGEPRCHDGRFARSGANTHPRRRRYVVEAGHTLLGQLRTLASVVRPQSRCIAQSR